MRRDRPGERAPGTIRQEFWANAGDPRQPQKSLFVRSLRAAILADFEPELELIERIAVLQGERVQASEIQHKLGTGQHDHAVANARLRKAAERLRDD